MHTELLQIDPRSPDPALIQQAVALLRQDQPVVIPTDTVYGICCNAFSEPAVRALYEAKGRPHSLPLAILIPTADDALNYARPLPPLARAAAARWWPGPLTIVLQRLPSVPGFLVAGKPTVGLRVPAHPVAIALIRACDFPLAATSANLTGQPSPSSAALAAQSLEGRVPLILDSGPCPLARESTVADFTRAPAVILREAAVTLSELRALLGPRSVRAR